MLRTTLPGFLAALAACVYGPLPVSADIRATPLALVGDAVPGGDPLLTIGNFRGWRSIGKSGETVFGVRIEGPNVTPGDEVSIWYGSPGSLKVVARDNDPAPGANGLRYYQLNAATASSGGHLAFGNRDMVWGGSQGALHLAAREEWQAPGTPDGTRFSWFPTTSLSWDEGIVVPAQLTGPDVTEDNDAGLWFGPPTALRLLAREGNQAFGFPEGVVFDQLDYGAWPRGYLPPPFPTVTDNGLVLFGARVKGPDEPWRHGAPAIWLAGPDGVMSVIRIGDPAPGLPPDQYFGGFRHHSISSRGHIVLAAIIDPFTSGVWAGKIDDLQLVALEGEPAPGADGAEFSDFSLSDFLVSPYGENSAVVRAKLRGSNVNDTNDHGLWQGDRQSLKLLFREGSPAPGLNDGSVVTQFVDLSNNDGGDILASIRLAGPGVTSENDVSLWHVDTNGSISLLAREGGCWTLAMESRNEFCFWMMWSSTTGAISFSMPN